MERWLERSVPLNWVATLAAQVGNDTCHLSGSDPHVLETPRRMITMGVNLVDHIIPDDMDASYINTSGTCPLHVYTTQLFLLRIKIGEEVENTGGRMHLFVKPGNFLLRIHFKSLVLKKVWCVWKCRHVGLNKLYFRTLMDTNSKKPAFALFYTVTLAQRVVHEQRVFSSSPSCTLQLLP